MCLASCVNRIDIPEEEDAMLFIKMEMLRGQETIEADFKTTNNLNGTYPIEKPANATIRVHESVSGVAEKQITFLYDPDKEKYVANAVTNDFLLPGREYKLEAKIDNSTFVPITSITKVPYLNKISEYVLIDETEYEDEEGNLFWQGTVGFTFSEAINLEKRFGHFQIEGFRTTIVDNEHIFGSDKEFFELVNVNVGNGAVTDIIHRDGFFVEFDELENNYLEVVLRSKFAITEENQVTDFLNTSLISVSKEHYDYHISFHNIQQSQGNIFEENALYITNINNGLGLFSSCVRMSEMIDLRK